MLARYMLSLRDRLSVRLSATSQYCIETTRRIELVFGICPTLCFQEMWVSSKIRYLPPGTLSPTLDFKNFATASQQHCQQNSSTVELVDDTYTTVDESWLFTTRRSTVTPLLRFVVDLLYKLFLQLTRFSLTHRVARSVCGCRASCLRHCAAAYTAITFDLGGGVSQTISYETRTVKAEYINLSSHNRPL